jgi:hypothetical protein
MAREEEGATRRGEDAHGREEKAMSYRKGEQRVVQRLVLPPLENQIGVSFKLTPNPMP